MVQPTLPDPPSVRRFDAERRLRAALRIAGPRTFETPQEERLFMQRFEALSLDELRAQAGMDSTEEAQELAFQALEATAASETEALARQALALDPDNLDAALALLPIEWPRPALRQEQVERLIQRATQALGEEILFGHVGTLWGVPAARPLFRLHLAAAQLQEQMGRPKRAAVMLEALLRLDNRDPLSLRHPLVRLHLVNQHPESAQRVLASYPEDDSAVFAWARVLERFLAGSREGATRALAEARARNPHVEAILVGKERTPRHETPTFERSSPEEAMDTLNQLGSALTRNREAMVWLVKGGRFED